MHSGYILSWRKKIHSDVWKMPPMYMRVFEWIIHSVNHNPGIIPSPDGPITINPGQKVTSLRQIAEGVAYFEYGVERVPNVKTISVILDWLKGNGMISLESNAKGTVLTVTKWHIYNKKDSEKVTQREQPEVTKSLHGLDTNKNVKNEKNKNLSASDDAASEYWLSKKKRKLEGKRLEAFKKFWTAFNYPKGRAEAIDSWLDIPEMTAKLVDTIIAAATREATERPQQQLSGKTPKMAQGWLTARRWEDGQIQSEAKPTIDPRYSQAFQRLQ